MDKDKMLMTEIDSRQKKQKNDVIYCEYCSKIFTQRKNLYRHIRNLHPGKDFKMKRIPAQRKRKEDVENCEYCPKIFSQRRNLYRHIRNSHPGENFIMKRKSPQKRLRNDFQSTITNQIPTPTDASAQQSPINISLQNQTKLQPDQSEILHPGKDDVMKRNQVLNETHIVSTNPMITKKYNNIMTDQNDDWAVIHVKRFQGEKKKEIFYGPSTWNADGKNDVQEIANVVKANIDYYKRFNYHIHYDVSIYIFNDKGEEAILKMSDCCGSYTDVNIDLNIFVMKLEEIALEYPKLNGIHIDLEEQYEYVFGDYRKPGDIGFNNM